jgi:RPA family protein
MVSTAKPVVCADVRDVHVRLLPKEIEKLTVVDQGAVVDFELETGSFTLKLHRVRVAGVLTGLEKRGGMVEALLSDGDGTARVRAWGELAETLLSFKQGDYLEVLGTLRVYRGEVYIAASIVRKIGSEGFDFYVKIIERDRRVLSELYASRI